MTDLKERRVLEVGPGEGLDLEKLHGSGARLAAVDISPVSLSISKRRCPRCDLLAMDGSSLGFSDSVFDFVFARTLLMHVEKELFFKECRRVLKPGGKAVFIEPLKRSPLLLPYRAALSSGRQIHPEYLSPVDLGQMRSLFESVSVWYFYLLSAVGAPFASIVPWTGRLFLPLEWLDRVLLTLFPFLENLCWISVIECTK